MLAVFFLPPLTQRTAVFQWCWSCGPEEILPSSYLLTVRGGCAQAGRPQHKLQQFCFNFCSLLTLLTKSSLLTLALTFTLLFFAFASDFTPFFLFANDAKIIFILLLFANPLMTRSLTTLSQVSTSRRSSFGLFTGEMVKKYDVTELVTSVTSVFPPLGDGAIAT